MTIMKSLLLGWGLALALAFGAAPAAAQSVDAINDLLRGGSGNVPKTVQPAPPVAALPEGNTWSAPKVERDGDENPKLTYHGQAAGDGRAARITLTFDGADVTGTIWIQSVCEKNIRLGGADLTFDGTLSGAWESKNARIVADWEGTEHFCGTDLKNHGTLEFFLKDDGYFDPVMHLRIMGERGRYGWNFRPAGKVLVDDPAKGSVILPTDAEDPVIPGDTKPRKPAVTKDPDADGKGTKPRLPWREPIDPDTVKGFSLLPNSLAMKPGTSRKLPWVLALIGDYDGGSDRNVPAANLTWDLPATLAIVDGKLKLSGTVKDDKAIPFTIKITLEELKTELEGYVRPVIGEKLGSISGRVSFQYSPTPVGGAPKRPVTATLELIPEGKARSERQRITAERDGSYKFENLRKGLYRLIVVDVAPTDFPKGYVLDRSRSWGWRYGFWSIPVGMEYYDDEPLTWDHKNIYASILVHIPPPLEGTVHGRVIYKGKGLEGVTVMAHNVADSDINGKVVSGRDGAFRMEIDALPDGKYWIRAEKYQRDRIAGPDDYLDIRTNRLEDPILVHSPLSDPLGLNLDIEVDKRRAIFGGQDKPYEIPPLPGEDPKK
ncbi:carboxypeptidase-like regulatory domain-containing protein [Antarctobacter sp.]|uniref:carboxypeptidase-like regulatory domain-containing protein n=1 Tax=Antarctobacter sp. TaxID=1872577 RepID=UPI002B2705A7|nr:carboxypeptidase-like regulatory domain-containing protein [Antarctobacter sp.]